MQQYRITLIGETPLIQHNDNLRFAERLNQWRKDPATKAQSIAGDDRSPAWTWLGSLYLERGIVCVPADNLMTLLREGAAKVPTGKGRGTYKAVSQAGLMVDRPNWLLETNGDTIDIGSYWDDLVANPEFHDHIDFAEANGFELLVKRAKIGQSKHVRVRPMFRSWAISGLVTVLDEEATGLTKPVIESVMAQAGMLVGLCDWRPSSKQSPGTFGRFSAEVERV